MDDRRNLSSDSLIYIYIYSDISLSLSLSLLLSEKYAKSSVEILLGLLDGFW